MKMKRFVMLALVLMLLASSALAANVPAAPNFGDMLIFDKDGNDFRFPAAPLYQENGKTVLLTDAKLYSSEFKYENPASVEFYLKESSYTAKVKDYSENMPLMTFEVETTSIGLVQIAEQFSGGRVVCGTIIGGNTMREWVEITLNPNQTSYTVGNTTGEMITGSPMWLADGSVVAILSDDGEAYDVRYYMDVLPDAAADYRRASGMNKLKSYLPYAVGIASVAFIIFLAIIQKNKKAKSAASAPSVDSTQNIVQPPAAKICVRCLTGSMAGKTYWLDKALCIGREPTCDIVYPENEPGVSARHCRLEPANDGARITDLGSTYGTFVGSEKLQPNQARPLRDGESFSLGDGRNTYELFTIKE